MSSNSPSNGGFGSPPARKAPALPTDAAKAPYVYDPKIGEEAYSAQADAIDRLDALKVTTPNVDASLASVVALQFASNGRRGLRRAAFESVANNLGEHTLDELDQRAHTCWYLDVRYRSMAALKSEVKIDLELFNEGVEARSRALTVLEYYFAKNPLMMTELADIRGGTGVMDLARDLARLAGHYSVHKAVIARDTVNYSPDDEQKLRGLANQILEQLNKDRSNETADLRNRAWTRMVATYNALKSAADFVFRDSPTDLADFPPLRTAVLALSARRAGEEPVLEPPAPTPTVGGVTPATSPAATAPSPAVEPPPGFPGGNPLT